MMLFSSFNTEMPSGVRFREILQAVGIPACLPFHCALRNLHPFYRTNESILTHDPTNIALFLNQPVFTSYIFSVTESSIAFHDHDFIPLRYDILHAEQVKIYPSVC